MSGRPGGRAGQAAAPAWRTDRSVSCVDDAGGAGYGAVFMEPERLTIQVRGMSFGALAWGRPGAPVALCLHGYPDTAWTWRHLGPHLAESGWRVVAPFTRGYGPTDLAPDDDYSVRAQSEDALALADAVAGDGPAVLIGHDWGAVAAHRITSHAPHRFDRVVTLALPPAGGVMRQLYDVRGGRHFVRQLSASWYMAFNLLPTAAEGSQDRLIPRLWRDWSPGYDAREDLGHVFDALRGPGRRRAVVRYYRSLPDPRRIRDNFVATPRQATFLLYGTRDGCILPESNLRARGFLAAGSRLEPVDGAGHFFHLERPDLVNRLIADHLAGDSPSSSG